MARYFRTIGHVYGESDDYGPAFASNFVANQPPGAGFAPPTDGTAANGKPIYSWDEAAAQLTRINLQWSAGHGQGAVVTYAFRSSIDPSDMPQDATGFQRFTSDQIVAANEALALWADVANITFERVGTGTTGEQAYSNNATILLGDFTAGFANSTGFTFYPGNTAASAVQGDVWINLQYTENLTDLANGGFGAHTLEHELGHAIGLAHPGDYDSVNGDDPTYDADAIYWQDSRAFTDMSYFGSTGVGFSLGSFSSGPQLHDIAAAQLLYGPNMTTRTGDTVYGFNSNTGHDHYSITSSDDKPVFSIWDAGGNDTLDLSGFSTNSEIDLRPESFSSAGLDSLGGAAIGNISIARGAIIENGIGGDGNDTITGNDVDNRLVGNGGDDILTGGDGNDVLIGDTGYDSSNATTPPGFGWDTTTTGNDTLNGGAGDDFLAGGPGNDTLNGGDGNDHLFNGIADVFAGHTTILDDSGLPEQYSRGNDTMDGGAGTDIAFLDYSDRTADITFTLNLPSTLSTILVGGVAHGSVLNVEEIVFTGGAGNDHITGGNTYNSLSGGGGDDVLTGGTAFDDFDGGAGNDTIVVKGGADTLIGGDGNDTADFSIAQTLSADLAAGTYSAAGGLSGTLDTIENIIGGALGHNHLNGDDNANVITGGDGDGPDDQIDGRGGDDIIHGHAGQDALTGGDGDDQLFGDADGDTLIGGAGADVLNGGDDLDTAAYSGSDAVTINLATGAASGGDAQGDTLVSIENLIGSAFNDSLTGDANANVLGGGDGDDTLTGGDGDDDLMPGAGVDVLVGGNGQDTVDYFGASSGVTASLIDPGSNTGNAADDTYSSIENLTGTAFADTLTGDGGSNVLSGGSGADTLNGGAGVDTALYLGALSAASWHRNPDGTWTVTAGSQGTDTLTSIEKLHFSVGAVRDVYLHNAARTFTGDGTSDILFRRADGIMASWETNGSTITQSHFLASAPQNWALLGTGDFNGDAKDDILWQRADGLVYSWTMNGGSVSAATPITGLGNQWHYLGTGDFNGDQNADIAWQRSDGVVYTWSMDGATITQASAVSGLSSVWHLQGVGDFNSDGKDDFLWRRDDNGQMAIWEMNGSGFVASGATSQQTDLGWSVKGIGDFDGDGRDDILMQRSSDGMLSLWKMDGLTVTSQTNIAAVNPAQWTLHDVGDYNGDGKADILWQKSDGLVFLWLMNGATITGTAGLSGLDHTWGII